MSSIMQLSSTEAADRLRANDHGILGTVHPGRGVDLVPVVYALDDAGQLAIPIDTVKAKTSTRLQRERNLAADPRATLLIEHWDRDDWSALWWVRVELTWLAEPGQDRIAGLATRLAAGYPQYRDEPFTRLLVFRIDGLTGWSAEPG